MKACEQTKGQSVYQHGQSVYAYFCDLRESQKFDWRLPSWFNLKLFENIHDEDIVKDYLIFHDIGKPFCREIDSEGKVHFPNHAETSKRVFLEDGGSPIAANLIGWDMVLHSCSAEEIKSYCSQWTIKDAYTLLLASLSEIHSNSRLFGGIESISFKSKWKNLERRGKQVCKHFFGEN